MATPFAGNVPHYDVLATNEALKTVPIQVKATNGNTSWIVGDARVWMEIEQCEQSGKQTIMGPTSIAHPDLITVYVWLSRDPGKPDRYFILKRSELQALVHRSYSDWLQKHGGVRPRKSNSYLVAIWINELEPFENNWRLILEALSI